jgi:hypothetical protein
MSKKAKRTIPGRVKKIIEHANEPKKAEISLENADPLYREIRIENKLQDEGGEHVELEPGQRLMSASKPRTRKVARLVNRRAPLARWPRNRRFSTFTFVAAKA